MLKKEKNLLIYTNKQGLTYYYDVNSPNKCWTNSKTQKPLRKNPTGLREAILREQNNNDMFIRQIAYAVKWGTTSLIDLFYRINLNQFDKIISLLKTLNFQGKVIEPNLLHSNFDSEYIYQVVLDNAKEFKKFCEERSSSAVYYSDFVSFDKELKKRTYFKNFKLNEENTRLLLKCDINDNSFINDTINCVKDNLREWLVKSTEHFNKFAGWFLNEFFWFGYSVSQYCFEMNDFFDTLENFLNVSASKLPTRNIIPSYIHYLKLEKEQRETALNNKLSAIDYSKYFYEDDNYITVFPKTNQDFVQEGKNMHHCVGGYGNTVANGSCIVIFIREKSNPEESFVTMDWHFEKQRSIYCVHKHNQPIKTDEIDLMNFVNNYRTKLANMGNN